MLENGISDLTRRLKCLCLGTEVPRHAAFRFTATTDRAPQYSGVISGIPGFVSFTETHFNLQAARCCDLEEGVYVLKH